MPQGAADGADSNTRFEFLQPLFYQWHGTRADVAVSPRHRLRE
eukprot:CAMPEP_0181247822 /NCGR_PEP_ID=MMETSP1096-20121128/44830_1 /TAXON_ID=156174 ORGANISM="Chrysochromulina ericina, Strain CCMP281" /NCGR_SAMPLE_ID=MMETSP1096 /ASSEMBLY_ACC=CAM_ASM_000453 /LENGTH=42 /DNA_ID= /DNA_START= /DNA_END= /DNA_ORIENTATION=